MPDALPPDEPEALPHGGDLAPLRAAPGAYRGAWLDLSTGINPWAYPLPPLPRPVAERLPGRDLVAPLLAAAAACYGAPSAACVVAAPGSQALIQWLPRLLPPRRVAVLGPTYGEHAAAWKGAGHRVATVGDLRALEGDHDVAIVTNPNNPDGRQFAFAELAVLAERLAARGKLLVIDEAFADIAPQASLAAICNRPGVIVIRSFGKFFGLAGLRLGFALTAPPLAARLQAALGPWAVSGPAAYVGARALADGDWIAATRRRLKREAARLDALLAEAGLAPAGGTSLFRLVETPDAGRWAHALARAGIHVRSFPEQPHWLRFGLPSHAQARARLRRALAAAARRPKDDKDNNNNNKNEGETP